MSFQLLLVAGVLAVVSAGFARRSSECNLPLLVHENLGDLPQEFDARTHWPHCSSIGAIFDTGSCRSSWAFAVMSTITDRYCIHKNQYLNISTQDLMTCCQSCQNTQGLPCQDGPYTAAKEAWCYWNTTGIVTGSVYDSKSGCRPYNVTPCDHYESGSLPICDVSYHGPKQVCLQECEAGYPTSFAKAKHIGGKVYKVGYTTDQIKAEIMSNGPVQSAVVIDKAFTMYKSGVYTPSEAVIQELFVKIIGWGQDPKQGEYWLCTNSWNREWGDQGTFKIRLGKTGTYINDFVYAGMP
ncbi:cathepsin B-like [Patiria miniata]|uniref:Peptidase C1A papain C-terminal domain-containing protein n=1 Tax=Patiria miniata TaxID=46514 RepID=A0A913ZJZ8_PATMI|nr:cathepsin B-like [Patiria miniata]XP_038052142.1 cathepsin B-like [Patiria miniata]